jgi:hypothetical protein
VALPVGIPVALLAASGSVATTTLVAVVAPALGAAVLCGGLSVARSRIQGRESELVQKVTPAR